MSKKVVTLLNKYGPMLSGELARKFEHEYGASNTAARQALSRAKKPVNKICTLSFDKNQKFFYLESQYMSNRYIERLMDAIKQRGSIIERKESICDKDFRGFLSLQVCIIDDAVYLDKKI